MKRVFNSRPILYLERGSLYRKDSSIIFQNSKDKYHIPLDSFTVILFGTGVKLSSNAVSFMARNNCFIAISSCDQCPKAFMSNISESGNPLYSIKQAETSLSKIKRLEASRKLMSEKFGDEINLNMRSTNELMLSEARNTKRVYHEVFGKNFKRDYNRDSDFVNKLINIGSNALYNYCAAVIHIMGLSPHLGILHGTTRNAFVFDLSEIFKTKRFYHIIAMSTNISSMLVDVSDLFHERNKVLEKFIKDVFS
jgi:CRISPR-associated protein Cas1